jgi:hypothetical protein
MNAAGQYPTRGNSGSGSSAEHTAQQRREEAAEVASAAALAMAQNIAAAQDAHQAAIDLAANDLAANNLAGVQDPAEKRASLIQQINAQNIISEKNRRIAKGLQILQTAHLLSKGAPFDAEEVLNQPEMIALNLNADEVNELFQLYIEKPVPKENNQKSLQFVDAVIRISPPFNEKKAKDLQNWSDKYQDEEILLSKILDKEAQKLLSVVIDTKKEFLGLTDDEAANWYENWGHAQLADVVTRLYKKNSEEFKSIDLAIDSFILDLEKIHILNTADEQAKITELHSLVALFPKNITENKAIQQRLFNKLRKDKILKENVYRKKMEIEFSENREQFPTTCIDDWIKCFAYVRNLARDAYATSKSFV